MEENAVPTNENNERLDLAFGTIVVAFLTFLGYMSTYFYSLGYYYYFQVPSNFIELSLSSIFKSSTLWLMIIAISVLVIIEVLRISNKVKKIFIGTILLCISILILMLFNLFAGNNFGYRGYVLGLVIVALLLTTIFRWLARKDKAPKILSDRSIDKRTQWYRFITYLVTTAIFCGGISFFMGVSDAVNQTEYPVAVIKDIKTNVETKKVIVGSWSNNFIALDFKNSTIFSERICLLPIASIECITYEELGLLKPIKTIKVEGHRITTLSPAATPVQ